MRQSEETAQKRQMMQWTRMRQKMSRKTAFRNLQATNGGFRRNLQCLS